MALSFVRYSDLLAKNREMFILHLYFAPRRGWTRRNFAKIFDTHKTIMIGRPCVVKKLWYYFDRMSERDRQTDEQTDGRTDRQNCYVNIARHCANARKKCGSLSTLESVPHPKTASVWQCLELFLVFSCNLLLILFFLLFLLLTPFRYFPPKIILLVGWWGAPVFKRNPPPRVLIRVKTLPRVSIRARSIG